MVLKKLKKFSGYYSIAHSQRVKMSSPKWRIILILIAVSIVLIANEYLQANYSTVVYANGKSRFLPETLFNWFMTGTAFGILILALMYEGEFILALRKTVNEIESNAKEKIASITKTKQPKGKVKKR